MSVKALKLPSEPRIIDGSHVEHAKPAPDLLLLAAEELETPPRSCWYVGDSTWDMLAAHAGDDGRRRRRLRRGVARTDLLNSGAQVVTSHRGLHAELSRRGLVGG